MSSKNTLGSLIDIFASPKSTFDNVLAKKCGTWVAFSLLSASIFLSQLYFFSGMGTDWIIEQQMQYVHDASPSEIEMMESNMAKAANFVGITSAVGSLFMVIITIVFLGGYYKLLIRSNHELLYSDWFAFTVWTHMPLMINAIGIFALSISSSSPDLPFSLANYASLNQLILNLKPNEDFFLLAETISLFTLWTICLSAYGLTRWTALSLFKATAYSVLPYFIVFGIWSLIVMS